MNRRGFLTALAAMTTAVPVVAMPRAPSLAGDPICDDVMSACTSRVLVISGNASAMVHMQRMFPKPIHRSVGAALTGHRFDTIVIAYDVDEYDRRLVGSYSPEKSALLVSHHHEWLDILNTKLRIGGQIVYLA